MYKLREEGGTRDTFPMVRNARPQKVKRNRIDKRCEWIKKRGGGGLSLRGFLLPPITGGSS